MATHSRRVSQNLGERGFGRCHQQLLTPNGEHSTLALAICARPFNAALETKFAAPSPKRSNPSRGTIALAAQHTLEAPVGALQASCCTSRDRTSASHRLLVHSRGRQTQTAPKGAPENEPMLRSACGRSILQPLISMTAELFSLPDAPCKANCLALGALRNFADGESKVFPIRFAIQGAGFPAC